MTAKFKKGDKVKLATRINSMHGAFRAGHKFTVHMASVNCGMYLIANSKGIKIWALEKELKAI